MTQEVGSTYKTIIPTLGDDATIVDAFKYYHQGGLTGSPAATSVEQHLININTRAGYIENAIGYTAYNPINPATTVNARLTSLESAVGGSLGATYIKAIPSSNDTAATRNLITPSVSTVIPLVIQGVVSQSANLQEWKTSAATVARVDSTGKLFSYSTTDAAAAQVVTISDTQTLTNKTLTFPISTIDTNARTASYVLVLSDQSKIVEMGVASGNTLTVPTNTSVPFPVGTSIIVIQTGAGQTTITPSGGVTINGTPGLKLRTQWSSATLIKRATDTWFAMGDLTA
jgi:hypothetical protein